MSGDGADPVDGVDELSEPWSVFDAVPPSWSGADIAALEQWRQGDLVTDLSVTWLMPAGPDDVTRYDNSLNEQAPAAGKGLRVEAAILCSQTCDAAGTKPGDIHPFVLVAPLVSSSRIESGSLKKLARDGKVGYLFPTLAPNCGAREDDEWYADLRLIVPVSKSVLLARTPVEGLSSDDERWSFAETIAQKFRRPALSEKISGTLPHELRAFIQNNNKSNPAFRKVEQVRVLIQPRHLLNPARAQLLVFMDSSLTDDEQALWRTFETKASALMSTAGIQMMPMSFTSAKLLTADVYRDSVPIMCDLLGFPRYP